MAWAALSGAVDLDGINRVVETAIDMSCFEFVPSKERIPLEARVEIVGAAQGRSPVTVSLVATMMRSAGSRWWSGNWAERIMTASIRTWGRFVLV